MDKFKDTQWNVVDEKVLENTVQRCKERDIIIPTYSQMINPETVPEGIKEELSHIGLWDLHPRNLFRITWKNDPVENGGGFDGVNYLELPSELTGVKAKIYILLGKYFPTGSHKVGATFGPLVEKLIRGAFDPTKQKALWPSTGNYCRGGAYDSYLLACPSIAVLPEEMSSERFEWLEKVGAEIYPTPGCESNVKEVYDKTKELKESRADEIVILNQFSEFGNAVWHYAVTGRAMEEVYEQNKNDNQRFSGLFLTQGSAGTLGSAEYLREKYPHIKVCAGEALQCPTLLFNGYGGHRIEGIGDKHVPWIHNLKNMDMVADIDDEACMHLIRLFNEKAGHEYLRIQGIDQELINELSLFGISSIANIIGSIKMAKYYEMNESDVLFTVATDSMELYQSRMKEMRKKFGDYTVLNAAGDFQRYMQGITIDYMLELSYWDKKRMHNLKYFTWIEQQGKTVQELNAQWYDDDYWSSKMHAYEQWDELIDEFNERTGLMKKYT
ncbi:MAG TPA: pyridoxal-phosphate dependent enzyme [Candidatus Cloacimonetes bacterium]|nr:pyridoxal-phosphate dependent enzyme [Candidatus Cloacimonadota bacterium]HEX38385.1 pyridoxal-phosphate dependent enzyme [Candidatus Cloacimonadota bacterium]